MNTQPGYEPCEECGAPLDPQQRYCVNCAARRGNGANPSSRYFAAMSKRARRPMARPPAKAPGQPGGGGRLLRAAADRGRARRRRRPQRLGQRRRRRPAAGAAPPGSRGRRHLGRADHDGRGQKSDGGESQKSESRRQAAPERRRQGGRQDQERHRPPGDRLQADQAEGRSGHQAGRRKPRTDRRQLHQGPAEPARRDRRRRQPERSAGAADREGAAKGPDRPVERKTSCCSPSATACWRSSR